MLQFEKLFRAASAADRAGDFARARILYAQAGQRILAISRKMPEKDAERCALTAHRLLVLAEDMRAKEIAQAKKKINARSEAEADENICFFPEKPGKTRFEDIAGLEDVKALIREKFIFPMQFPDAYSRFNQKVEGGILLYGPPGNGKTMLARAIATEIRADFFAISCSDIVAKYFGEAERRVKALFDSARRSENAIIFFDEFEALACKRGGHSTVMNRLIPELLAQMDGFERHEGHLTVVAATNRPWDLDPAFLRPPRLSYQVYISLPDEGARRYLIESKMNKMPHEDTLDIEKIVAQTAGFNCADIEHLCNRCSLAPIQRDIASGSRTNVITQQDVDNIFSSAFSSVNRGDMRAFELWQREHGLPIATAI